MGLTVRLLVSLLLALAILCGTVPVTLAEEDWINAPETDPILDLLHDPNGIPTVFYQGNTVVGPNNAVGIRGEYLDQDWTAIITDGEKTAEVELLQQNRQSFKFIIPENFKANTLYTLTLEGEKPLTVTLNKPVVQWIQGDEGAISTVGGWVRVQGECLALDETKPHTLTLTAADGTVTTLNADRVYDAYSVGFVIPELPLGDYKAVYANGFSEVDAGTLTIGVSPESTWGKKVYDVTKYKVDNTGVQDATAMLNVLLGHMGNTGGGILYFPAGRYLISGTLNVPAKVVLRGDGMDKTQLFWQCTSRQLTQYEYEGQKITDYQATVSFDMITSTGGNFAVEDMEFAAGHIGGLFYIRKIGDMAGYGNVRMENVRVNQNTFFGTEYGYHYNYYISLIDALRKDSAALGGIAGTNNKFINCEFNWSSWMTLTGGDKYTLIQNCTFNSTYTKAPIGYSANYAIVEDCTCIDSGFSESGGNNVYFARNTVKDSIYTDNREAMTTDGTAGLPYQGSAEIHEDGLSFTFPDEIEAATYAAATSTAKLQIMEGTGAGQWRYITGNEGVSTIQIESPFDVAPDESSRFTISTMGQNVYKVNCTVDNCGMVQFYTGMCNSVIDGFKINRSAGIKLYAKKGKSYAGTNWYCSVVNCEITNGNYYHTNGYMDYWEANKQSELGTSLRLAQSGGGSFLTAVSTPGETDPVYCMNLVFRNNKMGFNCLIYLMSCDAGSMVDSILDGNYSENTRTGIYIEGVLGNLLMHNNTAPKAENEVEYFPYNPAERRKGYFE